MTFKVTIWNAHKSTGIVRDYRFPVWEGAIPTNRLYGMSRVLERGGVTVDERPWFIEFKGDVPDGVIVWAKYTLHPNADVKNITIRK
jgi:hypothetical protein